MSNKLSTTLPVLPDEFLNKIINTSLNIINNINDLKLFADELNDKEFIKSVENLFNTYMHTVKDITHEYIKRGSEKETYKRLKALGLR